MSNTPTIANNDVFAALTRRDVVIDYLHEKLDVAEKIRQELISQLLRESRNREHIVSEELDRLKAAKREAFEQKKSRMLEDIEIQREQAQVQACFKATPVTVDAVAQSTWIDGAAAQRKEFNRMLLVELDSLCIPHDDFNAQQHNPMDLVRLLVAAIKPPEEPANDTGKESARREGLQDALRGVTKHLKDILEARHIAYPAGQEGPYNLLNLLVGQLDDKHAELEMVKCAAYEESFRKDADAALQSQHTITEGRAILEKLRDHAATAEPIVSWKARAVELLELKVSALEKYQRDLKVLLVDMTTHVALGLLKLDTKGM